MPPAKKKSSKATGGMQNSLAGAGMFPMLSKTGVAIGLFCIVPGAFWERCPESDKDKKYKCIVTEFVGMHTFGGGRKGSGFNCKEMGENGEGSLDQKRSAPQINSRIVE